MSKTMQKRIIIVLGMHRSGTSALTRGLTILGADPGSHLMSPMPDNNEKGFFEDLDLYALNEKLLASLGRTWQTLLPVLPAELEGPAIQKHKLEAVTLLRSKIESTDIFCMKDPRFSYLLPFWQDICERLHVHVSYVIATRNPLSVTQSLSKRDGTDPGKSYYLWLEHMLSSISHTIGKEYVVVDYDKLMAAPVRQIHRISDSLALPLDPASQELSEYKNDFLEGSLQHSRFESEDLMLDDNIPEDVKELYIALKAIAEDQAKLDDPPMVALLQKLQKQARLLRPALSTIQRFEARSGKLNQLLIERDGQIASFDDSLNQAAVEINTLNQTVMDRDSQIATLNQAVVDRDSQIDTLKQAVVDRDSQIDSLNQAAVDRDSQISTANQNLSDLLNSNSWRLTRGFRAIRHHTITNPSRLLRPHLYRAPFKVWRMLPISPQIKTRLKKQLFTRLPFLFKNTTVYKNWSTLTVHEVKAGGPLLRPNEHEIYVPLHDNEALENPPVQLIAFYLPQFHSIPENDEWWGKGFTEWTNVKPAKPQYEGHYQPHVPGELGYYDLTDLSIQRRQIELAKLFGVGGFCFYFYWFAGKRLLETPILNYLDDASLDFPFCLCWANENWSRRWDGLDNEILIAQQHSPEDDLAFIEYVSKYMRDSRYIRINGRPLLLVYRPSLLPSPKETAERWRAWCRDSGIGEIYLTYTQSFEKENPEIYGFDAAVEFPPNNSSPPVVTELAEELNPGFTGTIYDWGIFTERSKNYQRPDYTLFRGVTPSWDNTARRKTNGTIFANSSPAGYQTWLKSSIEDTLAHKANPDERLVFINAWNEWAEGAHLEPDQRYGYAYLEATRTALIETNSHRNNTERSDTLAIVIHAFYLDILKEMKGYLDQIKLDLKLYVTTPYHLKDEADCILKQWGHPYDLLAVENKGRDVLPFFEIMPNIIKNGHTLLLKLHTKKSDHREDGNIWRNDIFDKLLRPDNLNLIIQQFNQHQDLGMVGPQGHITDMSTYWGSNKDCVLQLAEQMGVDKCDVMAQPFVAGTMFYARISAIQPLLNLAISESNFEPEEGQVDGTFAHAVERAISVSLIASKMRLAGSGDFNTADAHSAENKYLFAD